jgi:hypothetical protein
LLILFRDILDSEDGMGLFALNVEETSGPQFMSDAAGREVDQALHPQDRDLPMDLIRCNVQRLGGAPQENSLQDHAAQGEKSPKFARSTRFPASR